MSEIVAPYPREAGFSCEDGNKEIMNQKLLMRMFSSVSAPVEVGRMDPGLGVNHMSHMRHSQELPRSDCEPTHPSEITAYVFITHFHPLHIKKSMLHYSKPSVSQTRFQRISYLANKVRWLEIHRN